MQAENRECYRVSTMFRTITASFGDRDDCPLVDVSPTGFALISPADYGIGKTLEATIQYGGVEYSGRTCIYSKRILKDGRIRYGVNCIDKTYRDALQHITMDLQRQQLRRLACRS